MLLERIDRMLESERLDPSMVRAWQTSDDPLEFAFVLGKAVKTASTEAERSQILKRYKKLRDSKSGQEQYRVELAYSYGQRMADGNVRHALDAFDKLTKGTEVGR